MAVASPMQEIGKLPDGRTLFWADPKHHQNPGFQLWDPDRRQHIPVLLAEQAVVPASEYDALSEAFRHFVAHTETIETRDVDAETVSDALKAVGYSDHEIKFIGRVLASGSRALKTRTAPAPAASTQPPSPQEGSTDA